MAKLPRLNGTYERDTHMAMSEELKQAEQYIIEWLSFDQKYMHISDATSPITTSIMEKYVDLESVKMWSDAPYNEWHGRDLFYFDPNLFEKIDGFYTVEAIQAIMARLLVNTELKEKMENEFITELEKAHPDKPKYSGIKMEIVYGQLKWRFWYEVQALIASDLSERCYEKAKSLGPVSPADRQPKGKDDP